MKKALKLTNILLFILSLIIAVVLWGYVAFYENPVGEKLVRGIPVRFTGEQNLAIQELMLVSSRAPTVDVRFSGRVQDFSRINETNLEAVVDLSGIRNPGDTSLGYEIRGAAGVATSLASLEENRVTYTVPISVDRIASCHVEFILEYYPPSETEDYIVDKVEFDHQTLKVEGPSKIIDTLDKAVVSSGHIPPLSRTLEAEFEYTLFTRSGPVPKADMEFLVPELETIWLKIPVRKLKTVTLTVNFLDGGGITVDNNIVCDIEPGTVRISGDPDSLDGINSIQLTTISLASLAGDKTETYRITCPDGIADFDGIEEAQVTVRIINAGTRQVSTNNITPKGVNPDEGHKYVLKTGRINVTLRGPQEELDKVLPSNVRVVADFGDDPLAKGPHVRPADITVEGFDTVGVVELGYEVIIEIIPDDDDPDDVSVPS